MGSLFSIFHRKSSNNSRSVRRSTTEPGLHQPALSRPTSSMSKKAIQGQTSNSPGKSSMKKYGYIPDNFSTLEEVTATLRKEGLESSNLIVGIDFTKNNEWTGKVSFNKRSLHAIGDTPCYNLMGWDGLEPMIHPLWVAGPIWSCDKNNYPLDQIMR